MTDIVKPVNGMASMLGSMLSEELLRKMGLGDVIDAANRIAKSGVVDKFIHGVAALEQTNERLARLEARLSGTDVEPGSGSGVSDVGHAFFIHSLRDASSDGDDDGPGTIVFTGSIDCGSGVRLGAYGPSIELESPAVGDMQ